MNYLRFSKIKYLTVCVALVIFRLLANPATVNGAWVGPPGACGLPPIIYMTIDDGNWDNPSSWMGGLVPPHSSADDIFINHNITLTDHLSINSPGSLWVMANSSLIITSGHDLVVDTGGTVMVMNDAILLIGRDLVLSGNMWVNNASVEVSRDLRCSGHLNLQFSTLAVDRDLHLGDTGVIDMVNALLVVDRDFNIEGQVTSDNGTRVCVNNRMDLLPSGVLHGANWEICKDATLQGEIDKGSNGNLPTICQKPGCSLVIDDAGMDGAGYLTCTPLDLPTEGEPAVEEDSINVEHFKLKKSETFMVFPNPSPSNGKFTLAFYAPSKGELRLTIVSMFGTILKPEGIEHHLPVAPITKIGGVNLLVNISTLPVGRYVLKGVFEGKQYSCQFVLR